MAWPERPQGLPTRVEFAFGADPAGDPGTWTWTDVSEDLDPETQIQISRGRSDEAGQTSPASTAPRLLNNTSDYTPDHPAGAHYPFIQQGVPARLSLQVGGAHLRVPDTVGARARTAATLAVPTDLDVRVELALDRLPAQVAAEGAPAGLVPMGHEWQEIAAQASSSGTLGWLLVVNANGGISLRWSPDGSTALTAQVTAAVPYVSGQRFALRATLDTNNGAGGWTMRGWYAPSLQETWTLLGEVTGSSTTTIYASAATLWMADIPGWSFPRGAGRYYRAELRNGIDGAIVTSPDFTAAQPGDTQLTDTQGVVWQVQGAAQITDWRTRVLGTGDEWAPSWPYGDLSSGDYAGEGRCDITISGLLRRLSQGAPALESALRRRVPSYAPLAYWPMEDDSGATQAYSPVEGVQPMQVNGLDFAADDTLAGSSALPKIAEGAGFRGTVPAPATSQTEWQTEFVYYMPDVPASSRSLVWIAGTGRVRLWKILYGPDSTATYTAVVQITGEDADGATVVNQAVGLGANVIGAWLRHRFTAVQAGSNVTWTILWTNVGGQAGYFSGSYTGSVGRVTAVSSPTSYHADLAGVSLGHLAVFAPSQTAAFDGADDGWTGERALSRMRRLAREEHLPISVPGLTDESAAIGPQRPDTLLNLLRECEAADGGILSERRDALGLQYRPRYLLYNQQPRVVLDAQANEITSPFKPVLDDQRLRNDITVSRDGGSSAAAADQESIAAHGRYEDPVTLSLADDSQCEPLAYWRLHRGTWPGMRYPAVATDLHTAPDTIDAWLDIAEGDRAQVANLPPQHPPGSVDLLIEGLTDTITPKKWTIESACSPGGIWTVGVVPETLGDDAPGPTAIGSGTSSLAAAAGATTTTLSVAVTGAPWRTGSGSDVAFDISIGGEVMTVAGISGSSPQTFTVTRSVNGISKPHAAGTEVDVAVPFVVAL